MDVLLLEQREEQAHARAAQGRVGREHLVVRGCRVLGPPEREQGVRLRVPDVRRNRVAVLSERGDGLDRRGPLPAIAQGDHAVAPQAQQESCIGRRRGRGVGEEGVDPRDRLVSVLEPECGIAHFGRGHEGSRLRRLDPEVTRPCLQPGAERRAQAHQDAAHLAGDPRVVGRELCRVQVRAERGELVAGGDGLVAPHHPPGERPLGVGGEPPGALRRERSGFGPPPLGAVGAHHRAEDVLGRLCHARALEDIGGLARAARPLEDNGEVEGSRGI